MGRGLCRLDGNLIKVRDIEALKSLILLAGIIAGVLHPVASKNQAVNRAEAWQRMDLERGSGKMLLFRLSVVALF